MKGAYPVLFTQCDNGVLVEVPDFDILNDAF